MKEVSCQILDPFFREGGRAKVPPETLAAGTGYELAHLRDKNERIEWNAYRAFVANARKIWNEGQLIEMGGAFTRSPLIRAMNVIARLLFTPRDFYAWMASAGSGAGNQLVTCVVPRLQELGPRKLAIELELAEGYEPCPEFFLLTLGSLRALPRVLGLPSANVAMSQVGRVSRYEIEYPAGGGALAGLRRALTWPFTARAAARELKDAHEVLRKRYDDLEKARAVLAQQATQLRTAHSIGLIVHGDLDLDRTLGAVAKAMVMVAGFQGVRLRLSVDVEGAHMERESAFGVVAPSHAPTLALPLEGRSGHIGALEVWSTLADPAGLLEVVVPTIATVIDDALSYTALLDYRQNLERKVETRTAELREARDALAATVVDLEEARRSRDKIFSNINHEIRTPLSLMTLAVGDLRKLLGERLEDVGRQRLDGIERGVGKLLRLVDGLLLLAAGQEKKLELRLGRCELSALLDGLVASWAPLAGQNGLTLVRTGPAGCVIRADELQLERAVANLVSNAIKFTPTGGRIEVELETAEQEVTIVVRDTGVGIDEEFKKRIFGRFEQGAAPLRGGGRGSGIGLSLVKELIEAHGGSVRVDNGATGGSEFRLRLPVTPEMTDVPAAAAMDGGRAGQVREAPAVFGNEVRGGGGVEILEAVVPSATVLVAEDEPELRRAVGELLRERYRVILAPDGLVALEAATKHMPDILVSDINMPGIDGLELTRRFRELPGNRLAPVLLLTAYANLADRLSGFEAGAVDYVCKPFEPEELRARVRSLLALRSMALKLHQTEKLAALGTLAAGLAHEMRNPANAIVNAIEPLREQLPPELVHPDAPVGQLLDVLGECAGQIAILSGQLLGFKRQGLMQREDTPIVTVITRALALVQPVIRDLVLHQDLGYKGTVACSPALLTQVLSNLLENAAHAAGPKGWVRLATRLEHDDLIIEVSDSGPGVPTELRERIFEPFFTTKAPGKGTGLGLSTAREIVGRHDGTLDVRDAAGGSVFRIELPTRRRVGVTATSMSVG